MSLAHSVSDFTKTVQWTSRKELLVCSNHLTIYDRNLSKIYSKPVSNCCAAMESSNEYLVVIRQSQSVNICIDKYSQSLQTRSNVTSIPEKGNSFYLSWTYDHHNQRVLQLNVLTKELSFWSCAYGVSSQKPAVRLTGLKLPRRLHLLQDGCILVSDYANNSLHKLQITGTPVWSCEKVDKPLGIGHDDVRRLIYVASENGCIYELSERGIYAHLIKLLHMFSQQLRIPSVIHYKLVYVIITY